MQSDCKAIDLMSAGELVSAAGEAAEFFQIQNTAQAACDEDYLGSKNPSELREFFGR